MFKHLIKKVREESNNSSILPENATEELNGTTHREQNESSDHETSIPAVQGYVRSDSNTSISTNNKSRHSSVSLTESKDDCVKFFSELLSTYTDETITVHNYLDIVKSWMNNKEEQLREKTETIDTLAQQNSDLRHQLNECQTSQEKNSTETSINMSYSQKQIDSLRSDNENLKSTIKSLRLELSTVEAERDDLLIKSMDVTHLKPVDDLQRQLDRQKTENQQQHNEIERLRQILVERDTIIEQQDQRLLIDHETQATQTDEDKSFVEALAEPDVDTLSKLQAELDDKNRTIKVLQTRYNDLRKTLQKEFHASIPKDLHQMGSTKTSSSNNPPSSPTNNLPLIHYDASTTSQSDVDAAKRSSMARQMTAVRKNVTFTTNSSSNSTASTASPAILPHSTVIETNSSSSSSAAATTTTAKNQKNGHRSSIDGPAPINATNFKYLKHVLLKFMTSTEDEAIHLIRAVSTLLNFSADEERLLRETLDYKMSWFGKMSRLKPLTS